MYKRILMAYDGSDAGQKALLDCIDLAQWSQAELFLIAVMPLPTGLSGLEGGLYTDEIEQSERASYRGVLDEGLQRLSQAGHTAKGEVLMGETVSEISRYAKRMDASLIVVGHKHLDSWAARWWRGSVSGALIEHAQCSVLVVITE
jgi:nucleotide-binding universal stress UspA family protein